MLLVDLSGSLHLLTVCVEDHESFLRFISYFCMHSNLAVVVLLLSLLHDEATCVRLDFVGLVRALRGRDYGRLNRLYSAAIHQLCIHVIAAIFVHVHMCASLLSWSGPIISTVVDQPGISHALRRLLGIASLCPNLSNARVSPVSFIL